MTDLVTAAHSYRSRGWRVIQLHSVGPDGVTCSCRQGGNCGRNAGKHPVNAQWQNTEPYSGPDIEELWSARPRANIGIATGDVSGIWVLDIDSDKGGSETMRALVAEHGKLPRTHTVRTGSGGYHYYFLMPEGVDLRNTQNAVGRGVDTRANGGQVVAPPSRSGSGVYTVLAEAEVAAAPQWLLELCAKPVHETTGRVTAEELPRPEDISAEDWRRYNSYTTKILDAERDRLRRLAVEGYDGAPWNLTTFEVSCILLELANSPWNSYSVEQAENDVLNLAPRDDEGFDDYTVAKTFASARQKVGESARQVPQNRSQEPDPLLTGPDVQRRAERAPQPGSEGPGPNPGRPGPEAFFQTPGGLMPNVLAEAALIDGPVAYGRDGSFWTYQNGVWDRDVDVVERRCVDLLDSRFRNQHVKEASTVVKHIVPYISGEPIEKWVNFSNGLYEWRTGDLVEHSEDVLSTIQMRVPYDPSQSCPTFDAFLAEVMHEDYVRLAWEMLAYLMLSGNPLQVAFMLYGTGGNGKGTLMRVIETLLGSESVANESLMDLNDNRFSAANLFGKTANLAGDIDGTYQESTANFKKLTGEDPYAAEYKFGQRFNFTSWAVPVFSANKIPGSADVSDGYLRRRVILHFHKKITSVIPKFSDLLAAELPGIAAKAITHLRPLMERGAFTIEGEALEGKEEFARTIDQVRQWVASGDPIITPESSTPVVDLYASYALWAGASGHKKVGKEEFSNRLKAIGFPSTKIAGTLMHADLTVAPRNETRTTPEDWFTSQQHP